MSTKEIIILASLLCALTFVLGVLISEFFRYIKQKFFPREKLRTKRILKEAKSGAISLHSVTKHVRFKLCKESRYINGCECKIYSLNSELLDITVVFKFYEEDILEDYLHVSMPSYIDCDVDAYFTPAGCLFPEYIIKSVSLNGEIFWVNEEVAHEDNAYKLLANSLQ